MGCPGHHGCRAAGDGLRSEPRRNGPSLSRVAPASGASTLVETQEEEKKEERTVRARCTSSAGWGRVGTFQQRPEHELLICCARATLGRGHTARIQELVQQGLGWDSLIHEAQRHGLAALLYQGLHMAAVPGVPTTVQDQLRERFHANAIQVRLLSRELLRLLALFRQENIQVIPIKGPVLAAGAYADPVFRPAGDLDFLVRRPDMVRAREVLEASGYRPQIERDEEAAYLETQLGYDFLSDTTCVELHWAFLPKTLQFELTVEQVWERQTTVLLEETKVPTLGAEDQLLFLCAHGAKHGWERLSWIYDIASCISRQPNLDWCLLMARAQALHCVRIVRLGLALAAEVLDIALPEDVEGSILRDRAVPRLTRRVSLQWFRSRPARHDVRALILLGVRERLRDRLRYLLHLAHLAVRPSPADRAFFPLPASLTFLYPILRAVRVLSVYGSHPLRQCLALFYRGLLWK